MLESNRIYCITKLINQKGIKTMEITKVTLYPYKVKNSNLKAFASVEFDEEFVVTGIKLLDGKKGLFIAMPSQADSEGEYHDTAFPITKEFREALTDEIINAYEADDEEEEKPKAKKRRSIKK